MFIGPEYNHNSDIINIAILILIVITIMTVLRMPYVSFNVFTI